MTLYLEATCDTVTAAVIEEILRRLRIVETCTNVDKEFDERGSVINIARVLPDETINKCEKGITDEKEPIIQLLFGHKSTVRQVSDRVGTLNSLLWVKAVQLEIAVHEGHVEVDVSVVGINFKNIAVSMGLVLPMSVV